MTSASINGMYTQFINVRVGSIIIERKFDAYNIV